MAILVTGGAGYIGSHVVAELIEQGQRVIIVDDLRGGYTQTIPGGKLYVGDIRDTAVMTKVFRDNRITGVVHLAADSVVGDSMKRPIQYYNNNVYGTLCLLEKMVEYDVDQIVFSSSAAVYGEPDRLPITETCPTLPTNTYGQTKLAVEQMLKWFDIAYSTNYISLRYFNAAGAHTHYNIGELHNPETHLIPLVLQVASGHREKIVIFGDDYNTKDGTCIRDYVHVMDLARAHVLALKKLRSEKHSAIYNLGNGAGFSVAEVIATARKVTRRPIPIEIGVRRPGDPAVLVASAHRAQTELEWSTSLSDLEQIIADAWRWHNYNLQKHAQAL